MELKKEGKLWEAMNESCVTDAEFPFSGTFFSFLAGQYYACCSAQTANKTV